MGSLRFGLTPSEVRAVQTAPRHFSRGFAILDYVSKQKNGVTCDEVCKALNFSHQAGSPRFTELVSAECLHTDESTRRTQAGGYAKVYKVSSSADLHRYFKKATKRKMASKDQAILTLGRSFVSKWPKAESKERLLRFVIKKLIQIAVST